MKITAGQSELPFSSFTPAGARPATTPLDWPLRPLPADTVRELSRLSSRWSRGQLRRRLGRHRIHSEPRV